MKTAYGFAPTLVGKKRDDAERLAAKAGFLTRIVMEDGFQYYITSDNLPNRVNLVLIDGSVVEVSVG